MMRGMRETGIHLSGAVGCRGCFRYFTVAPFSYDRQCVQTWRIRIGSTAQKCPKKYCLAQYCDLIGKLSPVPWIQSEIDGAHLILFF